MPCAGALPIPPQNEVSASQHQEIMAILRSFESAGGQLGILSLCRQLLAIFLSVGWVSKMCLGNDFVGIHPSNRNGLGVITQDVYELGGDILSAGWDDKECAGAICIEEAPSCKDINKFSQKVVRESCGKLPPIREHELRYGALACNHTVLFLRCVLHGMACDLESLEKICRNGLLSLGALSEVDELFGIRAERGMTWEVVHWKVGAYYGAPALALISEARNVGAQLARRENPFQVLKRAWLLSVSMDQVDWAAISTIVQRSKPPCAHYVSKLLAFVKFCSGGRDGWALEWLVRIYRANSLGSMRREIDPEFWEALAVAETGVGETPALKCAMILDNITAPGDTVKAGICQWLKVGDTGVFRKEKKKDLIRECEVFLKTTIQIMHKVDGWSGRAQEGIANNFAPGFSRPPPPAPDAAEEVLTPELASLLAAKRVVAWLLERQKTTGDSFNSLRGIGFQFLQDVSSYCPDLLSLVEDIPAVKTFEKDLLPPDPTGAGSKKAEKTETGQAARASCNLTESALTGSKIDTVDALHAKGFKEGSFVRTKGAPDLWKITGVEFHPGGTDLVCVEDAVSKDAKGTPRQAHKHSLNTFLSNFCLPKPGYENDCLHAWEALPNRRAEDSEQWHRSLARADILVALRSVAQMYADKNTDVSYMLNLHDAPKRLHAAKDIAKNTLVLVPLTNIIKEKKAPKKSDLEDGEQDLTTQAEDSDSDEKKDKDPSPYKCTFKKGLGGQLAADWEFFLMKPNFKDAARATGKTEDKVALFWKVLETSDSEKVNMQVDYVGINTLCHISKDIPSLGTRKRKFDGKTAPGPDATVMESSAHAAELSLPVLVNHKDIKVGCPLYVFKEKEQEESDDEKRPKAITKREVFAKALEEPLRRPKTKRGLSGILRG